MKLKTDASVSALPRHPISEYVSEKYWAAYDSGNATNFAHSEPYSFAFLEDFWRDDFYEKISSTIPSLSRRFRPEGEEVSSIYFEPYFCEEFVRLVYGKEFRHFLASFVGKSSFKRPADAIPQLRTFTGTNRGLTIHNDATASYNGVAFFNITNGWRPDFGGELVIWEKTGHNRYKKRFEFAPRGNSLSILLFSERSFHSVNQITGGWTRSNILVEADFH